MGSRIIEQLVYKINGDTADFDKKITASDTKANKFADVTNIAFKALAAGGILAVAKGFTNLTEETAAAADRVDKLSQKIGISRDSFQEWDFVLSQNGTSIEGLQMGLKTLSKAADEASQGTAEYSDIFDRLGVSVTDSQGALKSQEQLFEETFLALSDLESETERTALASQLLGRSATELSPALNAGRESIEELKAAASEYGLVLSDDVVDAGVEFTDNVDILRRKLNALKISALSPVVAGLNDLFDEFTGNDEKAEELNNATDKLKTTSEEYAAIVNTLANNSETLSETEKTLLEGRRGLLEIELREQLVSLSSAYETIENRIDRLGRTQAAQAAEEARLIEEIESAREGLGGLTDTQASRDAGYSLILADIRNKERDLEAAQVQRLETESELNETTTAQEQAINGLAEAALDGKIDISSLALSNQELYDVLNNQMPVIIAAREEQARLADEAARATEAAEDEAEAAELLTARQEEYAGQRAIVNDLIARNNALVEAGRKTQEEADREELAARSDFIDYLILQKEIFGEYIEDQERNLNWQIPREKELLEIYGEINEELENAGHYVQYQAADYTTLEANIRAATGQARQLTDATEDAAEETGTLVELWENWGDVASNSIDVVSSAVDSFTGEDIAGIGRAVQGVGEVIEDPLVAAIGGVIGIIGEGIDALITMENQAEIWANSMIDLSNQVSQTQLDNQKMVLDQNYEALQEDIDRRLQAELEAAGLAEETTIERLNRELTEAIAENDAEEQAELETQIARQGIIDKYNAEALAAEEAYQAEVRKYEHDRAILERDIAIAQAEISKNQAIADLGWFNQDKKDEVSGIYDNLITAIQSTPIPSYNIGSIRLPEDQTARVHQDEMILPATLAEQARSEGISITPTSSASGSSQMQPLILQIDGTSIGQILLPVINSGRAGKIEARIIQS